MNLFGKLFKEVKRNFTIMLIPHNTVTPVRITFSLSFVFFLFCLWSGLTIWAGYLTSKHIDYWRIRAGDKLMRLKVEYFAREVKNTRELLDEIKEMDVNLRHLLSMQSREKIIESGGAAGGPSPADNEDLNKLLTGKISEMRQEDIDRQVKSTKFEFESRMQSYKTILDFIKERHAIFRALPNQWPATGHVTSHFGSRTSPIDGNFEFHTGLDIANDEGTPVHATADGVVKLAGWEGGYGRLVVIDHGFGYETRYGHNSKIVVAVGDKVTRGQTISYSGSTGSSTGNHVHYEVQVNGKPVNPTPFLVKRKL